MAARRLCAIGDEFNLSLTLQRYRAWGEDAANRYDGTTLYRVFRCNGKDHLLSIHEHEGGARFGVAPATNSRGVWSEAQRRASHLLGLQFQLADFYRFAENDAVLRVLTRKHRGLRPTLTCDLFEMLVTSITAQQINLKFAFTVRSRLIRQYGNRLVIDGKTYFDFPTAEKLARVRPASLRRMQFSDRKAEYIVNLARLIARGELELASLARLPDEKIYELLLPIRGVGRWTVDWLLARGLGRGNAIAAGDLGVRKAIQRFYFNGEQRTEAEIRAFAERWGDFTNLAVHYLLMGLMMES